jgi:AbiV family abortive infection protein
MKTKAIKDLSQLSDKDLFEEIAEGLALVIENATRIEDDSIFLAESAHSRGCEILRSVAEEEAAKFLILLDAVRCDRSANSDNFSRQLGYFNEHLAKLIYAESSSFRLANFGEIRELIESMREEYYLDGPEGVEWIFPNRIIHERQKKMYVDYIESDGKHNWTSPEPLRCFEKGNRIFCKLPTDVLKLVNALNEAGCTKPDALRVIGFKWRPVKMTDDFPIYKLRELNLETLEALEKNGLLGEQPQKVYTTIVNRWFFPLYSLNLRVEKVDQSSLRNIQKEWAPDF